MEAGHPAEWGALFATRAAFHSALAEDQRERRRRMTIQRRGRARHDRSSQTDEQTVEDCGKNGCTLIPTEGRAR